MPASPLYRSVMALPAPDRRAVRSFFAERCVLETARGFPGCLAAELWEGVDGADLAVTALWSTRAGYAGWIADPWRAATSEALLPLLTTPPGGQLRGQLYRCEASDRPAPASP